MLIIPFHVFYHFQQQLLRSKYRLFKFEEQIVKPISAVLNITILFSTEDYINRLTRKIIIFNIYFYLLNFELL